MFTPKSNNMKKEIINTSQAPAPIGPYNQATRANNMLFISGQIPADPETGELLMSSIEEETHRVMKNLKAILEAAGLGFENVLKTSIFISDMDNFSRINEVYGSYFSGEYPARETVQVARLPKDVNVEISALAAY